MLGKDTIHIPFDFVLQQADDVTVVPVGVVLNSSELPTIIQSSNVPAED